MKRGYYKAVTLKNANILQEIRDIKSKHPFWGYRRIWAYLNYHKQMNISQNRVYRIMSQAGLLVKNNEKLKATRTPNTSKPRPTHPNQWWGIDMTKIMIDGYGWLYAVIVIDWYTKKVVGHYIGDQAKAEHWLIALDMAANRQFPNGIKGHGVKLMSDNGCQPTSISFMKACANMGVKQAFTSYNNPKGNADTERFMRTMKEELVWINHWTSPIEFKTGFNAWIEIYNNQYLHSKLGYMPPAIFEQNFNQNTHSLAA